MPRSVTSTMTSLSRTSVVISTGGCAVGERVVDQVAATRETAVGLMRTSAGRARLQAHVASRRAHSDRRMRETRG